MSEGTPILTPTFQSLISHNLLGLTDALNHYSFLEAYNRMRIIISMLKETHQEPLWNNGVKQIDEKMRGIQSLESTDYYRTGKLHKNRLREIAPDILTLFRSLMKTLHDHNYLEQTVRPRYTKRKKLSVE